MKNILVFGAYGLLGTSLCTVLKKNGFNVMRQGRKTSAEYQIDPTDQRRVTELIEKLRPDAVINLNAFADVDKCEVDPCMAFMGNTVTVETIANAIAGSSIHLIHISTDQVYRGPGPHPEEIVCPSNIYGITKYAGELSAIACGATVFRTNFIGRSESQTRVSFTDWLFQVFKMKKAVTLFEDILFSPLNICDLCEIVANTINLKIPGVFNLGSKEGISKAEFAMNFGNYLNFDLSHAKIGQSSELGLNAKRPQDMRMVVGKFETAFGVSLPTISHTILLTARDYINE